ncbi:hypothetical protein [Sphingomonas panaciterrae]|uniref:caspase family protein n=1 Tax=Sphingomonas panaciterrae TaxID=1462999 RepID=UPI002FF1A1DB
MNRVLLAIGCNKYDHLGPLGGAEQDAQKLFELLINPQIGDYDPATSRILLSPTADEVKDALKEILFGGCPPETLTITFAGHGGVTAGSFYMATRESRPNALSATSFALADLFRMIAEAGPQQAYIIIDACEAGGLTADLNVILKADLIGKFGTPGISLLATAASDEGAGENEEGGFGTSAVLACINGDVVLQDTSAVLDLVEIGRAVSTRVRMAGGQTPVVWGLNLYGPPSFCKNPHAGTGNAPLKSLLAAWPAPESAKEIKALIANLWEPYVTLTKKWDARAFVERLRPAFNSLRNSPEALSTFARRIADDFGAQAATAKDMFREIEVRAACAVALLPYLGSPEVDQEVEAMSAAVARLVNSVLTDIVTSIDEFKFALTNDGLVELYRLPIKLTRLLGWAGYVFHTCVAVGEADDSARSLLANLSARLFKTYALSLVSMNDEQAAHAAIVLTAMSASGLKEEGEQLVGHLFLSAIMCGGRLANRFIEPDKTLAYLLARHRGTLEKQLDLVAQPTELVAVLLRAAPLFDLADEFDESLIHLDHLSINAYLPDNYLEFGARRIEAGINATFQIGHTVWTVEDIENAWPEFPQPSSLAEGLAAMLSSLIFNDRVPWFLFPSKHWKSLPDGSARGRLMNKLSPAPQPASSTDAPGTAEQSSAARVRATRQAPLTARKRP